MRRRARVRRTRRRALASGLLSVFAVGCSLIVNHADSECATNADCARFAGTVCQQGACVTGPTVGHEAGPPTPDSPAGETSTMITSCTVNQDCAPNGDDWICRKSDDTCVLVTSVDCQSIAGPYTNDDTVLIGALVPTLDPYGNLGQPIGNAIRLAVGDFEKALPPLTDGGENRSLAVVFCNDTQDVDGAARHLHDDLGVPVVLGTAFSQDTVQVATDVTVPDGMLLLSPAAGSDLSSVRSTNLVWRTIAADTTQAAAMAAVVNTVLEPQVKAQYSLTSARVAVMHSTDDYGQELATALESALVINGQSAADAGPSFMDAPYGFADPFDTSDTQYSDAILQVTGEPPDIIVVIGYTLAVTKVLEGVESAWTGPHRPQYLLSNGMEGLDLIDAVAASGSTTSPSLRTRILGTAPGPGTDAVSAANMSRFVARYLQTFTDGSLPEAYAAANAYDALYAIAYGIARTRNADLIGKDVVTGLTAVLTAPDTGPTTNVSSGPEDVSAAIQAIEAGDTITLHGASGPLSFDVATGDVTSDIEVWCITPQPGLEASGMVYAVASSGLTGAVDPACTQ